MGLGIVLIAAGWLGIIPVSDLSELEASLCCPTMLFPTLFRLRPCTGYEPSGARRLRARSARALGPHERGAPSVDWVVTQHAA